MYKNIVIIICLFAVPELTHGQDREQLLKGHWQINFEEALDLVTPARGLQYDSLNTIAQDQMRANMAGQRFEFRADHGFTAFTHDGKSYMGTWELLSEESQIKLSYDQGAEFTQSIERLEPDVLVLKVVEDETSPALFHYLHLTLIHRP